MKSRPALLLVLAACSAPMPELDAGVLVDAGAPDAGSLDAGTLDAGTPDAGSADAGTPDAGAPDAGFELSASCLACLDQQASGPSQPNVQACLASAACLEVAACKVQCFADDPTLTCMDACEAGAPAWSVPSSAVTSWVRWSCFGCYPQRDASMCSGLKKSCAPGHAGYGCCAGTSCTATFECRQNDGAACTTGDDCQLGRQCTQGHCEEITCWPRGLSPSCTLPCCTAGDTCVPPSSPGGPARCCVPTNGSAPSIADCCNNGGHPGPGGVICL